MDILTPIGGQQLISLALEALIIRVMQHVAEIFVGTSSTDAQSELNAINQNISLDSIASQEGYLGSNSPTIQSYSGNINPNVGYTGSIGISPDILKQSLSDLPSIAWQGLKDLGAMLISEGKIGRFSKMAILTFFAYELAKAIQSLLLTGEEFLEHPYYFANMGLYLGAAYNQALNLRDNPQSYKEDALDAVSFMSALKITNEFINIGVTYLPKSVSTDWQFAFQGAKLVLNWNYFSNSINYNNDKYLAQGLPTPNWFSLPQAVDSFLFVVQGLTLVAGSFAGFLGIALKANQPDEALAMPILGIALTIVSLAAKSFKILVDHVSGYDLVLSTLFIGSDVLSIVLKIVNIIISQYDNVQSKASLETKLKYASAGLSIGLILINCGQFYTTALKINKW